MKSTSILLILAMVGTGFGQELRMPTSDERCYMAVTSKDAAKSMVEIPCPTSGAGKVSAIHKEPEPVDVPAIQEKRLVHTKGRHYSAKDGGVEAVYTQDIYEDFWTCADPNRALLTSVNGKRHSCHRIEP